MRHIYMYCYTNTHTVYNEPTHVTLHIDNTVYMVSMVSCYTGVCAGSRVGQWRQTSHLQEVFLLLRLRGWLLIDSRLVDDIDMWIPGCAKLLSLHKASLDLALYFDSAIFTLNFWNFLKIRNLSIAANAIYKH